MKQIKFLLCLILLSNIVLAQKQNVHSAWNYRKYEDYEKAKSSIDAASTDEGSMSWWKTWYYKGLIYQDIHQQKKEASLNAPDALKTAFEAYKKSMEIDPKHDEVDDVLKIRLPQIMQEYGDTAFAFYNRKSFAGAYENFKMRMAVYNELAKYIKLPADTGAIYNEAFMADRAGKTQEALPFYQQVADMGYKDAFAPLAKDYCIVKDTAKAIALLEKGSNMIKSDADILKAYINILYATHQFDKAIEKMNETIKLEPNNEILYVFLGQIYDQMNKPTDAAEQFEKAFKINPNSFDVVKSVGINIFNQAVKVNKQANDIPADKQAEYDALIKKRNEIFEKALPYLQKANQMKPEDEEVSRPYEKTKTLLKK